MVSKKSKKKDKKSLKKSSKSKSSTKSSPKKKTTKKKTTTKKKATKKKTTKKKTVKKSSNRNVKASKKATNKAGSRKARSSTKPAKSSKAKTKAKNTKKTKKGETKHKPKSSFKSGKKVEEEDEIKIIKLQPEEETVENKEEKIIIDFDEEDNTQESGEESETPIESDGNLETDVEPKKQDVGRLVEEEKNKVRRPTLRCPECGSTNLRWNYERGELVCMDCGTVIEESMIDFGPEWRAFDSYQKVKRQRTGSPIKYTKPNKGLVTEIDKYNRDIRGSKLSSQAASQMGRLRKWHKRSSIASSIERNLTIAMGDLERISSYLGLPSNIREAAALLYRKAVEKGLIRGRLIESVVAAVIYMVCRQYGIPRTLDEISEISGISKKEIGRTYRFLKKELYVDVPLTNPIYYVPRFASALGLSGKVQEKAKDILTEAVEKGLISGRGPTGVAAAAVYIASVMMGERRTQKEVAEVAGVTEVTIRNRYRELKRELNIDIEDE